MAARRCLLELSVLVSLAPFRHPWGFLRYKNKISKAVTQTLNPFFYSWKAAVENFSHLRNVAVFVSASNRFGVLSKHICRFTLAAIRHQKQVSDTHREQYQPHRRQEWKLHLPLLTLLQTIRSSPPHIDFVSTARLSPPSLSSKSRLGAYLYAMISLRFTNRRLVFTNRRLVKTTRRPVSHKTALRTSPRSIRKTKARYEHFVTGFS